MAVRIRAEADSDCAECDGFIEQLEEGTDRSSAWLEVTMFVLTSAEMEQELESIVIPTL